MRPLGPPTGRLLKAIDLGTAKPRGLNAALALDTDEGDLRAHGREEYKRRLVELDRRYGLNSSDQDIWVKRCKAMLAVDFDIDPSNPDCWAHIFHVLALQRFPGFRFKCPDRKRHGTPRKWTEERLAQLFADVEFLHKTTGEFRQEIFKLLPTSRNYAERWEGYGEEALRKAYSKAKAAHRERMRYENYLRGGKARIPKEEIDGIEAAIKLNALKAPLNGPLRPRPPS